MSKHANLSRMVYISMMLVASMLHSVLAAEIMVARDAQVLKVVSQAWGLDWNRTKPCSLPWLRCSTSGEVTYLNLMQNGLKGSIPESLGNLTSLETLSLGSNQLTGNIPDTLGKLTRLTQMNLMQNGLTGSIPGSLSNLTRLEILSLRSNQLTGRIPESLGNLINLTELDLSYNNLTGHIPVSLGDLKGLISLYLSGNGLTGSIPNILGNLTSLLNVFMNGNGLTGNIPDNLGNLTSLRYLYFGDNRLTGSIPENLGNLTNLTHLFLSGNGLTGSIPNSLGDLTRLQSLSLGRNQLTGNIPDSLGNLTNITFLYMGGNGLSGSIPDSLGNLTSLRYMSVEDNFFTSIPPALLYNLPVSSPDWTSQSFLNISGNCIPKADRQRSEAECRLQSAPSPGPTVLTPAPGSGQVPTNQRSLSWWIWLVISIIVALIILAAIATTFCIAKRRRERDHAMDLESAGISTLTGYTLAEIRSMTHNWATDNLLGSGGFGSVYKGILEGEIVAVKRLEMAEVNDNNNATKEFLNEVAVLSKVRHRNLVALKGFCSNRAERILVMDYVNNGNLADHLFYRQEKGLPALQWSTRCRIATTAAEALHYLHSLNDEKIIHRDIKAENILLDKSYNSHVCDFGLAKLMPQLGTRTMPTVATKNVGGTKGYMAPEWLIQGILSDKMDVYSFGIVLLEIVTGATRFKCYSLGDGPNAIYSVHEAAWIVCTTRPDALSFVLDADITEVVSPSSVISILRLALHCISEERRDRPTMERVVRMLKGMIKVPSLPTEPPSWLQEVSTTIGLKNRNVLQDCDIGETTLQELRISEGDESTHDTM